MTAGAILILAYWALFTIHNGFAPKLMRQQKANLYDRKTSKEEAVRKSAERLRPFLSLASGTLRVVRWVENGILVLLVGWVLFLLGAIITGSFFLLGYPL